MHAGFSIDRLRSDGPTLFFRSIRSFWQNSRVLKIGTQPSISRNKRWYKFEEQKVAQADYECKTRPVVLFLRNRKNAKPKSPVPSNSRDEGSGVGAELMSALSTAGPPLTSA